MASASNANVNKTPHYTIKYTIHSTAEVSAMKFSCDGKWIAVAHKDDDNSIKIFASENGSQLMRIATKHQHTIRDLSFSKDSFLLATASTDRTAGLWKLPSGKLYRKFQESPSVRYYTCCLNSTASCLLPGAKGTFVLFDVPTGNVIRLYMYNYPSMVHTNPYVTSMSLTHTDCNVLLSSMNETTIHFVDLAENRLCFELDAHHEIASTALSKDGNYCLASRLNSEAVLYDINNTNLVKVFKGHTVNTLAVNATFRNTGSKKLIVSGSEDSKVYIWDFDSTKIIQKLEGHIGPVRQVQCHPKENVIASYATDTVKVWTSYY